MEEELLKLEKEFARAIVKNDAEAIGQFVADDWLSSMRMEVELTSRVSLAP